MSIPLTVSALDSIRRKGYEAIPLYQAGAGQCALDLSDNTNLWGTPPSALRAIGEFAGDSAARYPAAYSPALAELLADYAGVRPDMVVTGCGSDDVIDAALRAFSAEGGKVCLPSPSFSMIPVFARANGMEPVAIPLTGDLDLDVEAMLAERARITYICSPNNPTGGSMSPAAVRTIADRATGLLIIDEAYFEFAGESHTALLESNRPILITRTMSKAFGLAGLRLGYGLGSPDLVREVAKARGPYKVSAVADAAARAVLAGDRDWVAARCEEAIVNRGRFADALAERGIRSLESRANFVLLPVDDAVAQAAELAKGGVSVRAFPGLPLIGDALRITIGPWAMMERCIALLTTSR